MLAVPALIGSLVMPFVSGPAAVILFVFAAAALAMIVAHDVLGQSASSQAGTAGPLERVVPDLLLRRRSVVPGGIDGLPRDALTGLPDRHALDIVATSAMQEADRHERLVAVVTFDLDRLTDVNGCHGFAAGDLVLRTAARRLASLSPELVVRSTGDRFVMLLTDLAERATGELAVAAALDRLAQAVRLDGLREIDVHTSASAGIAFYPQHGTDLAGLLQRAEMAMVEAKQAGGRRFRVYDEAMIRGLRLRNEMERDLKRAIDGRQLQLHYQPQFELHTGRVVGFEALMRWQHPERGWVPPAIFIPVAESSGLIRPLGSWLIREACSACRSWRDRGHDPTMAINISAAQLRQEELLDDLAGALSRNALEPDRLELELTESLFVDPSEIVMRRSLEQLAHMGVKLAIDDFGTGYSSLAYLKRLPVGKIKIDKSFIAGIGSEDVDEALVRAIIGLARTFGKGVLAEGIETEAQRAFLAQEGCEQGQGYLFSRPVPFAQCDRFFEPDPLAVRRTG